MKFKDRYSHTETEPILTTRVWLWILAYCSIFPILALLVKYGTFIDNISDEVKGWTAIGIVVLFCFWRLISRSLRIFRSKGMDETRYQ